MSYLPTGEHRLSPRSISRSVRASGSSSPGRRSFCDRPDVWIQGILWVCIRMLFSYLCPLVLADFSIYVLLSQDNAIIYLIKTVLYQFGANPQVEIHDSVSMTHWEKYTYIFPYFY